MKLSRKGAFAAGVVATLVLGSGTAVAANGKAFVLGKPNSATAPTSLSNGKGTALTLNSKAGTPPLRVNRTTKVPNLNADLLDGLSAGAFLRSTGKAKDADRVDGIDGGSIALTKGTTGTVWGTHNDADKFMGTARCPAGTVATGGGGYTVDTDDWLGYSGPDFNPATGALVPNSWYVEAGGPVGSGAVAFVTCYNPRGAVKGATTKLPYFVAAQLAAKKAESVAASQR